MTVQTLPTIPVGVPVSVSRRQNNKTELIEGMSFYRGPCSIDGLFLGNLNTRSVVLPPFLNGNPSEDSSVYIVKEIQCTDVDKRSLSTSSPEITSVHKRWTLKYQDTDIFFPLLTTPLNLFQSPLRPRRLGSWYETYRSLY